MKKQQLLNFQLFSTFCRLYQKLHIFSFYKKLVLQGIPQASTFTAGLLANYGPNHANRGLPRVIVNHNPKNFGLRSSVGYFLLFVLCHLHEAAIAATVPHPYIRAVGYYYSCLFCYLLSFFRLFCFYLAEQLEKKS